ncbi:MAG: DPP IV N-terminal domain-containing protein [Bacteroidales bacterium]
MTSHRSTVRGFQSTCVLIFLLVIAAAPAGAQDRLKRMPGYDDYTKAQQLLKAARPLLVSGAVTLGEAGKPGVLVWSADGKGFDYTWNAKRYHFDLATRIATQLPTSPSAPTTPPPAAGQGAGGTGGAGARTGPCSPGPAEAGRQAAVIASPDGKRHAIARDRNVLLGDAECGNLTPITTDGSEKTRVRYGTTPWVYGEELDQTTGMWWNKTGAKLAYYRFDESKVRDFYIAQDETTLQTRLDVEAYPKPGGPNPVPDLFVYDLVSKQSTRIDVRDGKPFADDVIGHYVFQIEWSPDGNELFVSRANRRQNVAEFAACSPDTGHCRVIVREEWPTAWVSKQRETRYLADADRFLWVSERNGFKNVYLYDLRGRLIAPITQNQVDLAAIVRVDEKANALWYLARDGDNFMKVQLHRVGLDGKGDRRLTDPAFNHQVDVSPDGRYFVDVAQTHDRPPFSQLVEVASARPVAQLASSDYTKADSLGLRKMEMFSFLAADGKTQLFGSIECPPNFDPAKRYPVLMPVYGGPASWDLLPTETFRVPSGRGLTPFGFIVVFLHTRASPGMGKRTLDSLYLKLGQTEIDDMAAGVKAVRDRPYVDKDHVGIFGLSYGGYAALMALLRYPDVFAAAAAEQAPTDWRNYDTIYAERYMRTPEENTDGYDKGSAMSYVKNLSGDLLIYYGTGDNNVHNTNVMQLIKALQAAGKHFEVQVGPDKGHGWPLDDDRRWEFLIQSLVVKPMYRLVY